MKKIIYKNINKSSCKNYNINQIKVYRPDLRYYFHYLVRYHNQLDYFLLHQNQFSFHFHLPYLLLLNSHFLSCFILWYLMLNSSKYLLLHNLFALLIAKQNQDLTQQHPYQITVNFYLNHYFYKHYCVNNYLIIIEFIILVPYQILFFLLLLIMVFPNLIKYLF